MTIVGVLLFSQVSFGTEYFDEINDIGVMQNMYGLRTFQVQFLNFVFYTTNLHTPGFIEEGVYNTRRVDGQIDYVPFYRWRAGPIVQTDRPLDFYIDAASRGFFVVKIPSTFAYTRDGRFFLDSKRRLVTLSGTYPVMGMNGEIIFPEEYSSVTVSRSGMIYVDGQPLDRLKVAVFRSFKEMQTMDTLNGAFFVMTEEIPILEGPEHYAVIQGHLEENNVLKAITGDMLVAKNAYDVNGKAVHLLNRAIGNASSLINPTP